MNFLFNDVMKINYTFTDNPDEAHIIYGNKESKAHKSIQIPNVGLLGETKIREVSTSWSTIQDDADSVSILLLDSQNSSDQHKFDLFSAIFYLISRYEEYNSHEKDDHGRYKASNSVLSKANLNLTPVIDQWAKYFKKQLTEADKTLVFGERNFEFIPTYDIDQMYCYRGKGFLRSMGGYLRDVLYFRVMEVYQRVFVLSGIIKDPYDVFEYIDKQHQSVGAKAYYFFLSSLQTTKYDKNVNPFNKLFKKKVFEISQYGEIGIHPSYFSLKNDNLKQEIRALKSCLPTQLPPITTSRQHYLRLTFPETYQDLMEAGVEKDFSLGYAEQPGFRSGTCTPHCFFDLSTNESSSLRLIPLNLMEVSLIQYLKLKPKEGLALAIDLIDQIARYNGTFSLLWHNSSLTNENEFFGWKSVYEKLIKHAGSKL